MSPLHYTTCSSHHSHRCHHYTTQHVHHITAIDVTITLHNMYNITTMDVTITLAGVSQCRICSDNFTCCHTETEAAYQSFHLTQSQYTDTGPTSPSTDPITPGQPLECQFLSHWYDSTPEKSQLKRDSNPESSALEVDALTTKPTRRS